MTRPLRELILEYFTSHPNQNLSHGPVVDWVTEQWLLEHETPPRDPWRAIRQLSQDGILEYVSKGVYKYDPDAVEHRKLENFTEKQKKEILERDGYRCVICGLGKKDGVELHVDHIKPKDKGGKATLENGQTLCSTHNFRKKNYKQTETGKKMFIRLYEQAKAIGDEDTMTFCIQILEVFEKNGINGHIEWKR